MKKKIGMIIVAVLCIPSSAWSQERWQADLQIRSVRVTQIRDRTGGKLSCEVTLYNENDDDAQRPTVRILFPVGVRFVSSTTGCTPNPAAADATHAFAVCNLTNMAVGETRTVEVTTTLPPSFIPNKTFGAFAWSLSPDPNPANNYKEGAP
jgi:hypothetical protein